MTQPLQTPAQDSVWKIADALYRIAKEIADAGINGFGNAVMAEADRLRTLDASGKDRREWQPIETAPKDRTFVLLSGFEYDRPPARWIELGHFTGHVWQQDGMLNGEYLYEPTHWMPLPAPPRAKEGK